MLNSMQTKRYLIELNRAAFSGAVFVCTIALYFSTYSDQYKIGFATSDPNAMVLPRIVLSALAIFLLIDTINETRKALLASSPKTEIRAGTYWLMMGMIAVTAAMPYTGFVLCVTPLVAAVVFFLGERRWLYILLTVFIAGVGFWFFFHHVLLIRLPSIISGGLL